MLERTPQRNTHLLSRGRSSSTCRGTTWTGVKRTWGSSRSSAGGCRQDGCRGTNQKEEEKEGIVQEYVGGDDGGQRRAWCREGERGNCSCYGRWTIFKDWQDMKFKFEKRGLVSVSERLLIELWRVIPSHSINIGMEVSRLVLLSWMIPLFTFCGYFWKERKDTTTNIICLNLQICTIVFRPEEKT